MSFKPNRPVRVGTKIQFTDAKGELPQKAKPEANKSEAPEVSMALKKDELLGIARSEGIEVDSSDNKPELIAKIEAARK